MTDQQSIPAKLEKFGKDLVNLEAWSEAVPGLSDAPEWKLYDRAFEAKYTGETFQSVQFADQ